MRLVSDLRQLQPGLTQHGRGAYQRQADQGRRVFTFDVLEQHDTQRFGLERARAVKWFFSNQVTFDLTGMQYPETDPGGVDMCSIETVAQDIAPKPL